MQAAVGEQTQIARVPKWYVVQVTRGHERAMAERLSRVLPACVLEEPVFAPAFEVELKVRGAWVRTTKPQLEGYLVAVSTDPAGLQRAVSRVVEFAHVLSGACGPVPLSREEAELLGGLCAPGNRVLPMSTAYKFPDGHVAIVDGPLKGHEQLIADVNRHKSTAYLRVNVAARAVIARAGLAVLNVPERYEGDIGPISRDCSFRSRRSGVADARRADRLSHRTCE